MYALSLIQWQCTPTLSLRERENRSPCGRAIGALGKVTARRGQPEHHHVRDRRKLFPLPEGEGQGEGERDVARREAVDFSHNYRTQRVPRRSRRIPNKMMKAYKMETLKRAVLIVLLSAMVLSPSSLRAAQNAGQAAAKG